MKRLMTSAITAAVVVAAGGEASAQDMMNRRASLFDLGVYAGGAWTSSWYSVNDEGYQVGFAPAFGAMGTFWMNPSLGVRLHGGYIPNTLPQADTDGDGSANDNNKRVMNSYLYDLDLVFRPFFWNEGGGLMTSTYLFLGGGGFTNNIGGGSDRDVRNSCLPNQPADVCLSYLPSYGTTGMGVIGAGVDLFPISSMLGLFGEVAVHGYDSPAHVCDEGRPACRTETTEDKFAFTPRAVLGLKAMFGDILPPPPVVVPPPVIEAPPAPVVETRDIQVCVVQDGMLQNVTATYNTQTGDTMVAGRRFSEAYPATMGYAAGQTWFINNEPITFQGRRYVRFGLPRVVGTTEVTRAGDVNGVGAFTEAGMTGTPEIIYIPVRPGCEFQPYQREAEVRKVRG